uniref:Uncharacterized protein n=1 Tax=Panagrolaimus sp. ES5 TaxID=591445 RepID=A0AC34GPP3_9BILA
MAQNIHSKKQTAEEEIEEETMIMHELGYHEKLDEMDEITNEIAFRIHSYHQVFPAFGDVAAQIDDIQSSLEAIRAVLKDTKHSSLARFKKGKSGGSDDGWYEARKELFAEELRKMKRVVAKIEKMLPDLEGYDDFKMGSRNVYKKLDQEKHAIEEIQKLIKDDMYIPKKSVITREMERQQRKEQIHNKKTIVKPAAAKVSSPVKENPAKIFETLMNEFEEKKVPVADTLSKLIQLFKSYSKFIPADDDLDLMFTHLGKILQKKDKKAITQALTLLSYFTKDAKYSSNIVKTDLLKHMAPLLHFTDDPIIESTLVNFINLAAHTKAIIDSQVLKFMLKVFELQDDELSYKSLQLLSKFSNGGEEAIKAIFKQDKNLFFFMVNHLDADYRPSRLPAFNSVVNTMEHADEELTHGMIDMGCVCDLCNFFYEHADEAFEALKNTLEKAGHRAKEVVKSIEGCGGYDYISEMNTEESEALIKKFFD